MLVLLNIGNTNTQIGYVEVLGMISRIQQVPTAEFSGHMIPPGCDVAAATVVPGFKHELADYQIFWVKEAAQLNVDFKLIDFNTLGSDRIANAAALVECGMLPGLSIDCGTAITFEMVDDHGIFMGGAIAPGRILMNHALNDYTAQLPMVELGDNLSSAVGCNTLDAIKLGINTSLIGGIKEFIHYAGQVLGSGMRVVTVGGDSRLAVDSIENIEYGGDDFTLRGIMALWELNRR